MLSGKVTQFDIVKKYVILRTERINNYLPTQYSNFIVLKQKKYNREM